LEQGAVVPLPLTNSITPGVAPDVVFEPGQSEGWIHLEDVTLVSEPITTEEGVRFFRPMITPPTTNDVIVAGLARDAVMVTRRGERVTSLVEAHPVGWYPPAVAGDRVAWVNQGTEAGVEQIWWMTIEDRQPEPLTPDATHARHVVGAGSLLAWVEPGSVQLLNVETHERQEFKVSTGFSAPPTAWSGGVCWETWGPTDLDIVCSDGMEVRRAGHQRWPSRYDEWLIFREGEIVWLMRAPTSPAE